MIELDLLYTLSFKDNFIKYKALLNTDLLAYQSIELLKAFDKYFDEFKNEEKIDFSYFKTFFFINIHPNMDDKLTLEYKTLLEQLFSIKIDPSKCVVIIKAFNKQEFYSELHTLLDKNVTLDSLEERLIDFKKKQENEFNLIEDVDMDIASAMQYVDRSNGFKWRCEALNQHFGGGTVKGDFGILCGYTDSGKTSFLASEMSYFAEQIRDDSEILWLNNEGDWRRILPRIYCASLNWTQHELQKNLKCGIIEYTNKMNGNKNRIRIKDIQGKHIKDIEKLVEKERPAVLIFDMLDHLRGFEKYLGGDGGSFERYSKLYQWALQLSAEYCPIIATSQLNRNGHNSPYPAITELRGSGVDKQSAATYMLVIGMLDGEDGIRYLSTPKWKISSDKSWKVDVKFDALRSRFE